MGLDGAFWDIEGTVSYIISRNFTVVALQFPDDLLKEASRVSRALQDECAAAGAAIQVTYSERTLHQSTSIPGTHIRRVFRCFATGVCDGGHHLQQPWCG